jgi:hypothetical protein
MTTQYIILSPDGTYVGPKSTEPAAVPGKTIVALTPTQYAALNALRQAHAGTPFVFNGTTFVVAPSETIRLALVEILGAQTPGVQTFFSHVADEIKTILKAGGAENIAKAKAIIATTPLFGDAGLAAIQTQMLAVFPS